MIHTGIQLTARSGGNDVRFFCITQFTTPKDQTKLFGGTCLQTPYLEDNVLSKCWKIAV